MKITYIALTGYTVYVMRVKLGPSYDRSKDSFPYEMYILPGAFVMALLTAYDWTMTEILWDFSIWVESFAILPQLILLQTNHEVDNLMSHYVAAMGLYRAFYILNWIYRYWAEGAVNWIGWVGGTIQTGLYCDFFYYFAKSKYYGEKLILPTSL